MKTLIIPVTPLRQNCSLLICETSAKAALVDPGGDIGLIKNKLLESGVELQKIFLTHGHLDHCGAARELADNYGVPIEGPHPDESFWLDRLPLQARQYGFSPIEALVPDRWLHEGETVSFGENTLEVFHCPGHTPGHIVFFHRRDRIALVGDVLFAGSIGRTDFPRGNHADLIQSIQQKLLLLGDDVVFVPGHGPLSTFGEERVSNPYLQIS